MSGRLLAFMKKAECIAICREHGLPAQFAKPGVADAFAGPATPSLKVRRASGRQRFLKILGQPRVDFELRGRSVVRHVIDPGCRSVGEKMEDSAGSIVAMDLINPAQA